VAKVFVKEGDTVKAGDMVPSSDDSDQKRRHPDRRLA